MRGGREEERTDHPFFCQSECRIYTVLFYASSRLSTALAEFQSCRCNASMILARGTFGNMPAIVVISCSLGADGA